MLAYTRKRRKLGMINISPGKSSRRGNRSSCLIPDSNFFPWKLKSRWSGPFTVTQVFSHGGAEVMHPEKGTFKVNTQRLKPYFGGEFHANKQTIPLSTPKGVK